MEFLNFVAELVSYQKLGAALVYFVSSAWGVGYVCIAMLLSAFIGMAAGSPMPTLEGLGSMIVFSSLAPTMPTPALVNGLFVLAVVWFLWVVFEPSHSVWDAWCTRRALKVVRPGN